MDDAYTDEPNENDVPSGRRRSPEAPATRPERPDSSGSAEADDAADAWGGVGARRGPRRPAEGVRIIGAEEAAAAIESGEVASRRPEDAPRFGDVPEPPSGPRPQLRFPGADPATVAKPAVADAPSPDPLGLGSAARRSEAPSVPGLGLWDDPAPPRAGNDDVAGGGGGPGGLWDDTAGRRVEVGGLGQDPIGGPAPEQGRAPAQPVSGQGPERPDRAGYAGPERPDRAGYAGPERPERPAYAGPERQPTADFDKWDQPLTSRRPPDTGQGQSRPPVPESQSSRVVAGPQDEGSSLPHWTEPPSGENPRILGDDSPTQPGDDLDAWSVLSSGPRWRDQPNDWEAADFGDDVLADEEMRVGAMSGQIPAVDDPYAFEEAPTAVEPAPARIGRSAQPRLAPRPTDYVPAGPGGAGRDVPTAVATGAIALGVVLVAAAIGAAALAVIVTVAVTVAAAELFQAIRGRGYQPATLLGLVATASLMGGVYWRGEQALSLVLSLFIVFTLLWYLTGVVRARPAMNIAVTVMAFLYVGFLGSFAVLLLRIPERLGITLLLGAIIATAAYDIGAFFVGRWAGKTPLAPEISPNKTFEGLVGGSLATLLVCLTVVRAMHPWDGGKAFWLAVLVSVAAPLGDLCESLVKRDLDVKDMGTVLPGHGGVLDRIDALLFVVPGTWYLVRLLFT